jgi:hypothetical protein
MKESCVEDESQVEAHSDNNSSKFEFEVTKDNIYEKHE